MKPQCWLVLSALAISATTPVVARPPNPPAPPTANLPDLRSVRTVIHCADCERPFDMSTHREVLDGLVSNVYVGELRRALYMQDIAHQASSKAHFDNCDFDDGIAYVDELLAQADSYAEAANEAQASRDEPLRESSVRKAFFAIGQALHAVQDFYAHSNHVEMQKDSARRFTDIPVITPWGQSGREQLKALVARGLISGFVSWGFPQRCPSGTVSHAQLAKDSATTASGQQKIPHLQNQTQYQIAASLAKEASTQLLDYAFRRWPILKHVNGSHVAFEVIVDRREP